MNHNSRKHQTLPSHNCCVNMLFTHWIAAFCSLQQHETILHHPPKDPCCFVSNFWNSGTLEWSPAPPLPAGTGNWNQRSWFSGGNVVYKRDTGLFIRNSSFFMIRRCSRHTSRTASGTAALLHSVLLHLHQGLQARHLLLAEDLLLLPILHFRLRASKVSFCTLRKHARLADAPLSHSCSCWISHRRAFNSTMSICNLRNSFHELHCSCHRNSCPELVFLSSLSCKSCLHSSDA